MANSWREENGGILLGIRMRRWSICVCLCVPGYGVRDQSSARASVSTEGEVPESVSSGIDGR